jgi:predicted aminopeptidase
MERLRQKFGIGGRTNAISLGRALSGGSLVCPFRLFDNAAASDLIIGILAGPRLPGGASQRGARIDWVASAGCCHETYQRTLAHERDFADLIMATRGQLDAVYANPNLTAPVKLQRKADIVQELRQNYARLKARWGGAASGYDYWFSEPINNAKLNTVSAYYDLKPAFEALLEAQGGDMEKFYHAVGDLARMPVPLRHKTLRAYLKSNDLSR